ncbi:hypothetical protein E2C01_089071 [Portunus trituberculatus]|uniref:Uncharacterized protein n=1 Tax=Portunus trituberculatus TaxID=210409 RepID=A0A5B7JNK8_PORTR|nr:hypothetical protein [Portunus trituberculatus]
MVGALNTIQAPVVLGVVLIGRCGDDDVDVGNSNDERTVQSYGFVMCRGDVPKEEANNYILHLLSCYSSGVVCGGVVMMT